MGELITEILEKKHWVAAGDRRIIKYGSLQPEGLFSN